MARGRKTEVDDDEIVATLRNWPKGNVYPSTSTVKDELDADYDRKTVYRRLDKLESEGRIDKIEVGQGRGKSVGWFAKEPQVTTPASNGGGFEPDNTEEQPTRQTTGLGVPGIVLIVAFGAVFAWSAYQAWLLSGRSLVGEDGVIDTSDWSLDIKGIVVIGTSAAVSITAFGLLAYSVLLSVGLLQRGLIAQGIALLIGLLAVTGLLYQNTVARAEAIRTESIEAATD